jgi:hypothetical protein
MFLPLDPRAFTNVAALMGSAPAPPPGDEITFMDEVVTFDASPITFVPTE